MNEFNQYIYSNFSTKNDDEITHTRIGDKNLGIFGGKYSVPDEKYEEFMEMYFNWVFVAGNDEYLTEVQLEKGPIYIDLDFRYDSAITSRQHTKDHNIDIVMRYMEAVRELIEIDNTPIDVYIMEKTAVNCLENKTKDGIHIIINLNLEKQLRTELRNRMLKSNLMEILDLPVTNEIKDIIDGGIAESSVNTQMIGSRKPGHQAYKVVQHLIVKLEGNYFEYEDVSKSFKLEKHIYNLSTRYSDRPTFSVKEGIIEELKEKKEVKKEVKKEATEIKPSNNTVQVYCELGMKHKLFQKLTGHKEWVNIGFIIKTELGDKGEDLFVDISRHDSKFIEEDVRALYKQFNKTLKDDSKKPLTAATLIKYLKDADKENAKALVKEAMKILNPKDKKEEGPTESTVELDPTKLEHFNSDYMNSFKDDYLTQKKYFENFICKVMRPEPQFIYIEGSKDFGKKACIFNSSWINVAFQHCKTDLIDITTKEKYGEICFTKRWLTDEKMRCYNFLDFIPNNDYIQEQTNKTIFNLFSGFNDKIKTVYNTEKKDIILKPFLDLGLELCGAKQIDFNFFLKWIAHMIQKPNERIPICIIIKGKQGTGKNVFLNAIGNLIGKEHYITSANPKDFFGDYAEGFYHKLLVNMNECEGKDTFNFEGKIKAFITEDTITINPKNVRPTEIRNVARVLIFTNKANPIPIDVKSSDRRYCVYQTTDKFLDKKYGTTFWTKLIDHFNKPEFIACLYDYLNTMDISKVDWKSERPITEAYKQMCKLYVPVEALFFEEYVNKHRGCMLNINGKTINGENWEKEFEPRNKEVYDDYVDFCKSNGFSSDKTYQASISKFNNKCDELEIPHKIQKSNGNNEFRYMPKQIYEHLLKKKWINRDIDDPEIVIEDIKGEEFNFEI